MLKYLICLLWGHGTFTRVEKVIHPPISFKNVKGELDGIKLVARMAMGTTTTSLICPRCGLVKVITQ
jgi:hypothetical protein